MRKDTPQLLAFLRKLVETRASALFPGLLAYYSFPCSKERLESRSSKQTRCTSAFNELNS